MSYTKGPWRVSGTIVYTDYTMDDGYYYAVGSGGKHEDMALFAAAPDLLEALELIIEVDNSNPTGPDAEKNKARLWKGAIKKARSAIAKAKGE